MTKADLPEARETVARCQSELGKEPILISAVTGEGLNLLTNKIAEVLRPKPAW